MGSALQTSCADLTYDTDDEIPELAVRKKRGLYADDSFPAAFHSEGLYMESGPGASLAAIFDFDNTLASRMVFQDLGGRRAQTQNMLLQNAQAMLARNPNFWFGEFGGPERVNQLHWMLSSLRSCNVDLFICSFNEYNVIEEALRAIDCLTYFTNAIDGCTRICRGEHQTKGIRVKKLLSCEGVCASGAMFIDDSLKNCDGVELENPGIAVRHCGQDGLTDCEMALIVENFSTLAQDRYD